jgi:flavin-dependent dehydrogenase
MHDIIIVGAGVTGCYLAKHLQEDYDCLVLEKDRKIKLKDSGIVSRRFLDFYPKKFIAKEINEFEFVAPSGATITLSADKAFAFILKRKQFTEQARSRIKKSYGKVEGVLIQEDHVEIETDKTIHQAKLVIGCDGANSVVRMGAGIRAPKMVTGIMVKSSSRQSSIRVHVNKYFSPDFYAWELPSEHGLITAIRPKEYLDYMEKKLGLYGDRTAYPIPFGLTRSYAHRCLLVGDAASQTKPLTGGGIILGLTAANHAIETAKAFLGDYGLLSNYERLWEADFGAELRKQMWLRQKYRNLTNKQIDSLFTSLKPHIEKIHDFDYDHLSKLIKKLPKLTLLKHALGMVF